MDMISAALEGPYRINVIGGVLMFTGVVVSLVVDGAHLLNVIVALMLAILLYIVVFAGPHDHAASIRKQNWVVSLWAGGLSAQSDPAIASLNWSWFRAVVLTRRVVILVPRFSRGMTLILPLMDIDPGDVSRILAWAANQGLSVHGLRPLSTAGP